MPPKLNHSDDELSMLTDEEREGLLDPDLVDDPEDESEDAGEGGAAAAVDADPDKPAAQDPQAPNDKNDPPTPEAKSVDPAAGQPPAAPAPTTPPANLRPATAFPVFTAPADADARLASIEATKDKLAERLANEEIDPIEHRAQMKQLEEQERPLRAAIEKAEWSRDANVAIWSQQTVPAFLAQNPQYAPGHVFYTNLDAKVRELQTDAIKNGRSAFDPEILERAHKELDAAIRKQYGIPDNAPVPTPKRPDPPPSLAHVPAADVSDTGDGGEFAYLDRLAEIDPLAYERALARLPPDKADLYLQS